MTARVRLESHPQRLPPPPEIGGDGRRIREASQKRPVEPEAPLENRGGAGEAAPRQARRQRSRVACPAGVKALDPGAVLQMLEDSGGEAAGDAEGSGELGAGQTQALARHECGRKGPADRGRVPAARVELPGGRHPDPRHRLVAGHHGGQDRRAIEAERFAEREGRRHDHRRGVADRDRVRVVVIQAVSQAPVGQDGHGRRGAELGPDHRALPAPPRLDEPQDGGGEILGRRSQRDPQDVEHAEGDVLPHLAGNGAGPEVVGKLGEDFGACGHRPAHCGGSAREGSSRPCLPGWGSSPAV